MPMGMTYTLLCHSGGVVRHISVGFLLFIDLEGYARTSFCE